MKISSLFKFPFWIFFAILIGVLLWLSWPPNKLIPFIFLLYGLLLWSYSYISSTLKYILFIFLVFAIFNTLTFSWFLKGEISNAIFAFIGTAFFQSIPFLFYTIRGSNYIRYLSFIATFLLIEYLQVHLEIGNPLIILGNSLSTIHPLIQWYEITGVYGGTLWILVINILLLNGFVTKKVNYKLLISIIIIPSGYSIVRYFTIDEYGKERRVLAIHPTIDCFRDKYQKPTYEIVNHHLELSKSGITQNTDYVIWPETSITNSTFVKDLNSDPSISMISDFLVPYPNCHLITGIITYKPSPQGIQTNYTAEYDVHYRTFNAAIEIGKNVNNYFGFRVKNKLVPFEERIPYPTIFNKIGGYFNSLGGFKFSKLKSPQDKPVFHGGSDKILTIICYESAYGEYISSFVHFGAKAIFIILNEGWYQNSNGADQFLNLAKLRAIETRKYIVRSSNFGISSFINSKGDVVVKSDFLVSSGLAGNIYLNSRKSIYSLIGDFIPIVTIILSIGIIMRNKLR